MHPLSFSFFMFSPPPRSTLFPYTTLFRSRVRDHPSRSGAAPDACLGLRAGLLRMRSEEHTSELQSHSDLVCRLLLEKKKKECHSPWCIGVQWLTYSRSKQIWRK